MRWRTANSRNKRNRRPGSRHLKAALWQILKRFGKRGSMRQLRAMHKIGGVPINPSERAPRS